LVCGDGAGDRALADMADHVGTGCEVVTQNDAPVAVDDEVTTDEDTAALLPLTGAGSPAANDTDADGDTLTVTAVSAAASGTVAIVTGTIRFEPTADVCGAGLAGFDYQVSDGGGGTDVGRVTVTVICVDDPPTATDDIATVVEDSGATTIDVLANDTDIDGGPKAIESVTDPANGTVAITNGGAELTYQPDLDFCRATPDPFAYTLTPGGSTATVSITVTCEDDRPTAVDDTATVFEDSEATAIDVLANDTDVDGGPKAIESVTDPANGTAAITGDGTGLTYQPDPDFCGETPDTFNYTLNGGDSATVSVTVRCSASISTSLSAAPAAPAIDQTFDYHLGLVNTGVVPLDGIVMTVDVPVQMDIDSVTTGAYTGFAGEEIGVGVLVEYEKNTAPGVFTLWNASPDIATNTTLTAPPVGLGAGEFVTRVRWKYGQAAPGASATVNPRIRGQIINPDNTGNPVTTNTAVGASVVVSGVYTAGPTNVNDDATYTFNPSA
jgi:hypothetical protein